MKQRMLAGELYQFDEELAADSNRAAELTHRINSMAAAGTDRLRPLFRDLFGAFGEGTHIRPQVMCDVPRDS